MCEGRAMSNRTTYNHTVIKEAGETEVHAKKWTNPQFKEWTKALAHQSFKFLIAFTFMFAGSLYSQSSWAGLPKLKLPKVTLPNIPLPPPPIIKLPKTPGGVVNFLNPLAPITAVATGNGNFDQGSVASGVNGSVALAVKTSTPVVLLGLCGKPDCKSVEEKVEKALEGVVGLEPLKRAEEDVKEGLRASGEIWSAGQNGRDRDIERAEEDKRRVEDGRKHAEELRTQALREVDIEMAHLTSQLQRQEHMIKQLKSVKLTGEMHTKAIDELAETLEKGTAVYDTLVAVVKSQNSDLRNWVKNFSDSEFETNGMVSNLSFKLQDYVEQIDQVPQEEFQRDEEILSRIFGIRERLIVDLNEAIESIEASNIDLKKSVAEAEKRRASL